MRDSRVGSAAGGGGGGLEIAVSTEAACKGRQGRWSCCCRSGVGTNVKAETVVARSRRRRMRSGGEEVEMMGGLVMVWRASRSTGI